MESQTTCKWTKKVKNLLISQLVWRWRRVYRRSTPVPIKHRLWWLLSQKNYLVDIEVNPQYCIPNHHVGQEAILFARTANFAKVFLIRSQHLGHERLVIIYSVGSVSFVIRAGKPHCLTAVIYRSAGWFWQPMQGKAWEDNHTFHQSCEFTLQSQMTLW